MNDFTGKIKRDEWKPPSGTKPCPLNVHAILSTDSRCSDAGYIQVMLRRRDI